MVNVFVVLSLVQVNFNKYNFRKMGRTKKEIYNQKKYLKKKK